LIALVGLRLLIVRFQAAFDALLMEDAKKKRGPSQLRHPERKVDRLV
jgi:hypothetical protein